MLRATPNVWRVLWRRIGWCVESCVRASNYAYRYPCLYREYMWGSLCTCLMLAHTFCYLVRLFSLQHCRAPEGAVAAGLQGNLEVQGECSSCWGWSEGESTGETLTVGTSEGDWMVGHQSTPVEEGRRGHGGGDQVGREEEICRNWSNAL